jgi:hypothetical protein
MVKQQCNIGLPFWHALRALGYPWGPLTLDPVQSGAMIMLQALPFVALPCSVQVVVVSSDGKVCKQVKNCV